MRKVQKMVLLLLSFLLWNGSSTIASSGVDQSVQNIDHNFEVENESPHKKMLAQLPPQGKAYPQVRCALLCSRSFECSSFAVKQGHTDLQVYRRRNETAFKKGDGMELADTRCAYFSRNWNVRRLSSLHQGKGIKMNVVMTFNNVSYSCQLMRNTATSKSPSTVADILDFMTSTQSDTSSDRGTSSPRETSLLSVPPTKLSECHFPNKMTVTSKQNIMLFRKKTGSKKTDAYNVHVMQSDNSKPTQIDTGLNVSGSLHLCKIFLSHCSIFCPKVNLVIRKYFNGRIGGIFNLKDKVHDFTFDGTLQNMFAITCKYKGICQVRKCESATGQTNIIYRTRIKAERGGLQFDTKTKVFYWIEKRWRLYNILSAVYDDFVMSNTKQMFGPGRKTNLTDGTCLGESGMFIWKRTIADIHYVNKVGYSNKFARFKPGATGFECRFWNKTMLILYYSTDEWISVHSFEKQVESIIIDKVKVKGSFFAHWIR